MRHMIAKAKAIIKQARLVYTMWNCLNTRSASTLLAFVSVRGSFTHHYLSNTNTESLGRSFVSTALKMSAPPPKQYVLRYGYVPEVLEKRPPHREKHLELAKEMCLSGGPTAPLNGEVPTGALFIFETLESAEAFVKKDPYVTAGIVTGHTIEEWTVAIQN